ncbi:hypothetical protein N7478_010392 [Penicillium angulare]|uniref:uncharacterized protein n=1 Tax=Penicillium angulare TaxID=116970 RepID=UPI002540C9CC|nr:uncharacterized protein N7478_010392 [Penicillium angulare]KAJ5267584.1 hypothetical protein N7478_010392 [Penicillium angulare]
MDPKLIDAPSPITSSVFLPLGRRRSRASMTTTQTERENIHTALDQIHTTACQSDSLTLFNEFTAPPAPASAADEKGLSEELHGGLSGLYTRFRTSVGGMRDIVGGGTRSTDKTWTDSASVRSPASERSMKKSVSDLPTSSIDHQQSHPNSSQGSRLHSPVATNFQVSQEAATQPGTTKGSKRSSKSASISSKTSISASPAVKPNIAPLTKSTGSSMIAADSANVQLHVNTTGQNRQSRSSSVNVSHQGPKNAESASLDSKDGPMEVSLSQSASVLSQNRSHSPVLSIRTHESLHEEHNPLERGSSFTSINKPSDVQGRKSVSAAGQSRPSDDSSIPSAPRNSKATDPNHDPETQSRNSRSNSRISLGQDDPKAYPASNFTAKPLQDSGSTSDKTASVSHGGNEPKEPPIASVASNTAETSKPAPIKNRLPGHGVSRASTAETTTTVSSLPPLNTALDKIPSQVPRERRDGPSRDGMLSQLGSKLLSKDFWMRDENAKDCFHCGEPFTTFRRKHHCRTCGQIFDSKCTLPIPGTRFGQPGSIRVCKPCEAMINAHDDDSSEFSDSEQSPIAMNPRVSELSWSNSARQSVDDDDSSSVISQSIDHVLKTPTMAIPATRRAGEGQRSAVLEINPDRPLARPNSSRSLRSSLGGRPHSMGHKRHPSRQQYIRSFKPYHDDRAPFQRRHADEFTPESRLPAFHKDNIIDPDLAQYLSDDASSGDEQPSLLAAVAETHFSKSGEDRERVPYGGFLAAMKKGRSAFGDRSVHSINHTGRDADEVSISSSRAVNLPRPSRHRNLSVASSAHRQSPRASKDMFHLHDLPIGSVPFAGATNQAVNQSGFKQIRSSSMRGVRAPPVELNKASRGHVRKLLQQLLTMSAVSNADSWENALMPILLKAADEVDPDVQQGDDMDIRHYVKLKKIPGGRPGDTSYVSGLVFTKNLALKSMPRNILRPNILIITFPLEYARQQQHFMSLEPVIRQEREFLENLVSRIAALRPNILLVETNVSGLALGLLEQAGIATAYNVKSSVLEAVSRCTQTRIVTSMDKLLTTALHSDCRSFDVKTYVHRGRKKTYMYISGCPKELGCTIVLRGGDEETLGKVKEITEFMIYVVYNLRLETCLMRDEFAKLSSSFSDDPKLITTDQGDQTMNCNAGTNATASQPLAMVDKSCVPIQENKALPAADATADVPDDVPMPTYFDDMVHDHKTIILSASPFVKFEPPYLLMRTREMERRLAYLKRLRDQDGYSEQSAEEKAKPQKFTLITPEMVHESPHDASPQVKEVLRAAHDAEYDRVLYHYQTQKRQWEAYVSGATNMFDPYAHQNIVVLYSLVCTTTSIPCSGPDSFALEFYNEHGDDTIYEPDCTIGQYVEDLCHTANAVCTANGCEKRMFEHHRQYVHGDAQISVLVQPYQSKLRGMQDSILMWSCCKICGNETQVTPMSENTWKYSFGKYLEVSFWGRNLHARAGVCPHDLQRDHLRYFGFKDLALRIQYDTVHLLEVIVPRPRVTWKVDNDLKLRNEVYLKTERRLSKFMLSVHARLNGINSESVVPELFEACQTEIERLVKKANEDQAALIKLLQAKYSGSRYWEIIPLNEVLRSVQEKVVEWDTTFTDFERAYFPSEKDIKRLATLQLKKIFLDKDVASVAPDDPSHAPTEMEDETTHENEKPRLLRRMTLSPEKAQNVLVSVVEEHAGKKHRETEEESEFPPLPPSTDETGSSVDNTDAKRPASQEEAVSEQEVRHLDLAIPSPENSSPGPKPPFENSFTNAEIPGVPFEATSGQSLPDSSSPPLSPKSHAPLQDNSKSKEEAIPRSPSTPPNRPSAIPRLAEGAVRRSGKARSPPLIRAQSQPAHLLREKQSTGPFAGGAKTSFNPSESFDSRGNSTKTAEKKFTERLGFTALKNGRFSPGHSLIPRSTPKGRNSTQVSSLARHFEQLSREFEKERQRERRQRAARGTQSRAFPLASSKPIVEVYRNVREAVEEREPPADGEDLLLSVPQHTPEESSRISEGFAEQIRPEESPTKPVSSETPPESFESGGIIRSDSQIMSEAELDESPSDDERNTGEDLHPVDSQEETKLPEDDSMDYKDLAKHERTTLLKMLTNFWSERSASGWAALDYPLTVMDHVFADCDIIVREDEPSSLVAFALDSSDYKEKLASIQKRYDEMDEKDAGPGQELEVANEARVERALLRPTGTHLKYQFQEGQAKMLCKVFYAEQFDALRKKCGVADRIVESLSRCAKWDSKGGKTKSLFLKTLDDRFILKSLSPVETQAFLKFAPAYFQIMSEALFHELPSAIAKMFGFYQVIIKNPATGMEFNWFLLLMENLFYDRKPNRIFDLKGSMRNRKVESTGERDEVLLDENMVDFIYETPLFSREHSKKLLSQSVWNDTLFLGRQNVMDYSLMIAIDDKRSELVVGIIDCIRTYTWDKKLESWIKDRGFAGGNRNRPTVTSPKEYKSRFREAMARYVLQAPSFPSCWHQFQASAMYRYPQGEVSNVTELDMDGNAESSI